MDIWVVTRHADICSILRDTKRFSSLMTLASMKPPPPEAMAVMSRGFPRVRNLVNNDPPEHTSLRRLCNRAFTRKNIASMEDNIREFAERLVDGFIADGQVDLVSRFNNVLPKLVIADIVGVPRADIEKFGSYADEAGRLLFAVDLSVEGWIKAAEGHVGLQHYIAGMAEMRAQEPLDDLISALVHAGEDEGIPKLDMVQIVSLVGGFLIAGHKTTTDMLGNAMVLLLRHPDTLQALVEDPNLVAQVVEEAIRRDAPVPGMSRTTTEDVEIASVSMPKGTRLFLLFASANHDEALFDEPMRFDIQHENASMRLGFGHGVHFCIGAPLVRLEGQIALQVLTRRLRNLRFADDVAPRFARLAAFRGPVALNLAWDR